MVAAENALEQQIGDILGKNLETRPETRPEPQRPRVVQREATLSEQWSTLEKIDRELRERIRKERLAIVSQFDTAVVEIENTYREKIENSVALLEQQKKDALADLAHQTAQKLREHDLLNQRMSKL